jgi:GNAT superfamily N-acetyltransferase
MFIKFLKNAYGELTACEVHVQANLDNILPLPDISPYHFKNFDIHSQNDILRWIEIVNDAYPDSNINISQAESLLTNHHFLNNVESFMIWDKDEPVATVSIGTYKSNPEVGGLFRLAVRKDYQNKGLGKSIILLGYYKLMDRGIKFGESVISSHRTKSMILHFKCGMFPQYDPNQVVHKNSNFNKNIIQRIRGRRILRKAEKMYKKRHYKN